ncbi:tetrahydrofolate dehydrogenase/cyclohydrolase catalytic domain-containing protein [Pseudonocardia oroxyli]|uniref:5,10-methylene-tetrahydrofolate dehydrogenase/Methenyl tetrahydrofolate cyclohydrolase n=1 Tax=Pseudonocardia oroxyli TaxID=366584 RepID=A0A1G8EG93_PSEOR|nr:tetrahydrofolate dehydrogenase/cyclohydrolase catalytic domain-containing protein [Pseudonocardia oroxyli]SDH68856.1 5,10-methylene-tetrahydrofolate dehydrogenase/Methenyl tetrahydrofolate cyclohydrolase [Pseudonocardia oroxyli]
MSSAQYRVPGAAILREVVEAYQPYREIITEQLTRALVLRFDSGPDAPGDWALRVAASQVSAEQKQRTFERLGASADIKVLGPDTEWAELDEHLAAANETPDIAAVIVQTPPPRHLVPLLDHIAPAKDIDALGADSARPACATADGITRVAAPYLEHGASVAVIGSRGFVGSGVVTLLRRGGHEPLELDQGDDLRQVREVDVVISTTGRAGLLTAEHLHRDHQLVVDSGFIPYPSGPIGDVHPSAAHLPRAITLYPAGSDPWRWPPSPNDSPSKSPPQTSDRGASSAPTSTTPNYAAPPRHSR